MKNILSVLVKNRAGVLSRTAVLFARRGFNIKRLAVGETSDRHDRDAKRKRLNLSGCVSFC